MNALVAPPAPPPPPPPPAVAATVSLDFETFSSAGMYFDGKRWRSVAGNQQGGLPAVGAEVYAEHPSAEVLMACYSFDGGVTVHTWVPGMPNPDDLLEHVRNGGIIDAYNSFFEWLFWEKVCRRLYGWPELPLANTRDTMANARAYGLPGALGNAARALGLAQQKDTIGKGLIRRFCIPRSPTKKDLRLRYYLGDDHENAFRFYEYCRQDVRTEAAVKAACPPLSEYETAVWKLDQEINERGVAVDIPAVENCAVLVARLSERLTAELVHITNGRIVSASQVSEIQSMLADYSIYIPDVTADTVEEVLGNKEHPVHAHPWARRVLEIRRDLASASVKKLAALGRRLCKDGRVRGLFAYYGAERTGRWAGRGPQPQNLPRGKAKIVKCTECGLRQRPGTQCFKCWGVVEKVKWNFATALEALESFKDRDLDNAILRWGDVLAVIAGCLRSLFVAAPGHRFVCSDYSAIEAVVLAALAGEEWRLEVFRTHGKIYEMSASKITGTPLEDYLEYKRVNNEHHPDRQAIGKVAELACFGADTQVLTDNGWKPIVEVTTDDKLHDGVEWVEHGGVVSRGEREVIDLAGVEVTPDHKVYAGALRGWTSALNLFLSEGTHIYALGISRGLLEAAGVEVPEVQDDEGEEKEEKEPRWETAIHEVFDVLDCGPRSRFVIRTTAGPLIVHNSGYGGGLGAWKAFGADDHMTEDEIKANVKRWRQESPAIVGFWYGLERTAINAILSPGNVYRFRDIHYYSDGKVLRCILPSGRALVYHQPTVEDGVTPWGAPTKVIWFWGWNSNPKYGPLGWVKMKSYGGRLCENVVQAASRDIMAHGMLHAAHAGYRIVLHVHDELVCEQPNGHGSVEELERLMGTLPPWAAGWPVRAAGGWLGQAYRKD